MRKIMVLLVAICLWGASCAPPYRNNFIKLATDEKYTREQQLAALHYSYRLAFMKEEAEKAGKLSILYSKLPKAEVRKQLDRYLSDLSALLNYKEKMSTKYLDAFGLRSYFEHEEKVWEAIRARIRVSELDDEFKSLMNITGTIPDHTDEFGYDHSHGYDPSVLAAVHLEELFPFESSLIEEAKKNGTLQKIESHTIKHDYQLYAKEQDPNAVEDENKFLWRSKEYALEVTKYKIIAKGEKPTDNLGSYLEAYRITDKGRESHPALKAFLMDGGEIAIVVIDIHQDNGKEKTGFGLPDFVEKVDQKDLLSEAMIQRLYPDDKQTRIPPAPKPPVRADIVHIGGEKIDVAEKSADAKGFVVPFTYKILPSEENYNIKLKIKLIKGQINREIEYIIKEWTGGSRYIASTGMVIEYYRSKAPFNQPLKQAKVLHEDDTKKLSIIMADGDERTGVVVSKDSLFISDKPFAIAYTVGGKRYYIEDRDGDGIYESRKEIAIPKDEVGSYGDQESAK